MKSEKVKSLSCVWPFTTPWTVAYQLPLSKGFSRQEYWSGWPFPSPWDLPNPGNEPRSLALQADALPSAPPGKPSILYMSTKISPEYSLEGLMLKLQYFGHLMWGTDSLEQTLMLGKIEGRRRGDDRGWDGWVASQTQWTWVWASSGSWWWTEKPDVLQSMGLQRVRHDWATELNWESSRWYWDSQFLSALMYSPQILKTQHFSTRTLTLAYQTCPGWEFSLLECWYFYK